MLRSKQDRDQHACDAMCNDENNKKIRTKVTVTRTKLIRLDRVSITYYISTPNTYMQILQEREDEMRRCCDVLGLQLIIFFKEPGNQVD